MAQGAGPITKNDYNLEIFQGPLLAPGRITGIAGANAASAEAIEGVYNNAAAPAVREAHSTDHFEWEPSGTISFPGAYSRTDFSNRGDTGIQAQVDRNKALGLPTRSAAEQTDRFLYLNGGLWGQLGKLGATVTADVLRYEVSSPNATQAPLGVGITRIHAAVAYSFLQNQLVVGGGLRAAYVDISENGNASASTLSMFGLSPQAGLIVKPENRQFRVGITARMPVSAGVFDNITNIVIPNEGGTTVRKAGSFIAPRRIVQPWEVEAGVAYQLGPRPLNPAWVDPIDHRQELKERIAANRESRQAVIAQEIADMPDSTVIDRAARQERHVRFEADEARLRASEDLELANADEVLFQERRARYLNWPRERVLLLASVLMTGASTDAVALEGFIEQRREIVGTRISVSPRFAVESEAVPNFLKIRGGIYLEPSRFTDGTHRQHFTFGADFRLFEWNILGLFPDHQWRISAFLDAAERYQNFGIGVGTWH